MAKRNPDYFPKHIDQHVPSMVYAADVNGAVAVVDMEEPAASDYDYFLADQSISGSTAAIAASSITLLNTKAPQKFGVNVLVTQDAYTSADAGVVTVTGRDYLGQYMTETITFATATNATTASGVKAFKWVDSLAFSSSYATGRTAASLYVGTGTALGLPYRTLKVQRELSDASGNASPSLTYTSGTTVAALDADTDSTAVTADVRGTYIPVSTLNGTGTLVVECIVDRNNLHGVDQA